jgi:hypothetical protein
MNLRIVIYLFIVGVCFSCGQGKYKYSSDFNYFDEVNRENEYFTKLMTDSVNGIYEDFDIWNFSPTQRIEKYYKGLNFPIIEIQRDSSLISKLIIHNNYQACDTINVNYMDNEIVLDRIIGCPCSPDHFSEVHITKSKITQFGFAGSHESKEKWVLDCMSEITPSNSNKFIRYVYQYDSESKTIYPTFADRSNFDKRPIEYEVNEQVTISDKNVQVEFVKTFFDYAPDSLADNLGYYLSDTLLQHPPFHAYQSMDNNFVTFPSLKKRIALGEYGARDNFKSLFWYVWYTRLQSYNGICTGFCP